MKFSLGTLLVLCLAACATFPDAPLPADVEVDLGAVTEMSGALLYQRKDGSLGRYLLAMRVDGTALDFAVMTPQAVPLYRVQAAGSEHDIVRKLAGQGEPDARVLLRALRLIYGQPAELSGLLQSGWKLRETAGSREFYRGGNAPALQIAYEGTPPWYRRVHLNDSGAGTILSVEWLEY